MNREPEPEGRNHWRWVVLAAVCVAPWAMGAIRAWAYTPLLLIAYSAGLASWARGHVARARGIDVPLVPLARLLFAFHGLVLLQLLPLPPGLLRLLSPGSFGYHEFVALGTLGWRPFSVSWPDTLRGLWFLGGMALLGGFAFRELASRRWRRLSLTAICVSATLMTFEALVQRQSGDPGLILGFHRPTWDWAVFGPYVNRNQFAGYVEMVIPLAFGLTLDSFRSMRREGLRPRDRWLAWGSAHGLATLWRGAMALVLIVGIVASGSRGGVLAFSFSMVAFTLVLRPKLWVVGSLGLVVLVGIGFVGLEHLEHAFATRGIERSRIELWRDAARLLPEFALLGCGFNAFSVAYPRYQTVWRDHWFGHAHNDYLQAALETGLAGAGITVAAVAAVVFGAGRRVSGSPIQAGLFAGLLAVAVHAMVDCGWQIPANAATFALLAGLAMQDRRTGA